MADGDSGVPIRVLEVVTVGMLAGMTDISNASERKHEPTDVLLKYLQRGRDAVLWKLDSTSEYDSRRPVTPTGTNLLGIVKHLAMVDAGYLGVVFGRPFPENIAWFDPTVELNADMWATADQSRSDIVDLYRRVWAHSNETVRALGPDAQGTVPWWLPDTNPVSVQLILVHLIAETHRHAGHMDIVRELIDGSAGLAPANSNLASDDAQWWSDYRARVEEAASTFR